MNPFAGIEAFVQVVESGSFTAAAERLQTAKSSVSETVRGLEERLGVRLFDRTTRQVRPTEAGLAFYARCRRLVDDAESARAEAQALHEAPAGSLRIAAPDAFGQHFIVPALRGFLAAHPAIQVDLVEEAAPVKLAEEGFDLAIRISEVPAPNLVVRRLATSQVILVAASAYLATAGEPATPEDLPRHQCVGFAPLPWRDHWRLDEKEIVVRPRLLTNSSISLRAAALAGLGIVALPDWLVMDAIAAGRLARVLADCKTPDSGIYAVYPGNRLITPKVRLFVDYLARDLKARGIAS